MLKKSLAGVAAGTLLVGGGALATAQAGPATVAPAQVAAQSVAVKAAPAAADYPGSVFTRTRLTVRDGVERKAHRARIVVTAGASDATPRGTAVVRVAGKVRSAAVRQGVAVLNLPRTLKPGSYTARANFIPPQGSQFKRSSDADRFRVLRAKRRANR